MSVRFVELDGCACPRLYYPLFRKIKALSGCTYNSINRSEAAAPILHRNGKHTQAEVIALYEAGTPGYGPANPVDRTSHCCRNDGVVRPDLPAGARLKSWEVGWDVDDDQVDDVISAIESLGGEAHRPYSSGSEYHHGNITKLPPRWKLIFHAVFGIWPNGHKHRRRKGGRR